jgi:predicted alpha/beta-hydrolase family hydrolase
MPGPLLIDVNDHGRVTGLVYLAPQHDRAGVTFVLAHGAGADQSSPFMVRFGGGLAARGLDVVTFNFLYSEQRRRIPDRTEKLEACYRAVVTTVRDHDPFTGNVLCIGGKSMGGRIASHLAAAEGDTADRMIAGLVFLGYPLHPPGKPQHLRAAHLDKIRAPMLFVQGSRDPFGTPAELNPILESLPARTTLHVVENGDHSLVPSRAKSASLDPVYEGIQDAIAGWAKALALPASPKS